MIFRIWFSFGQGHCQGQGEGRGLRSRYLGRGEGQGGNLRARYLGQGEGQVQGRRLANASEVCVMKDASSSFSGFIRVHMNLARPITISLSRRPHHYATDTTQPGAADDGDDEDSSDETLKCLSFYLPHGTSKVIHVGRYSLCPSVVKSSQTKLLFQVNFQLNFKLNNFSVNYCRSLSICSSL